MNSSQRLNVFRNLSMFGAVLALCVVVLGAWVRLNAAGLGCPDWPGCYGHISAAGAEQHLATAQQLYPDRKFEYAKAVKEMLHRYVASTLGLIIIALACIAVWNRRDPRQPLILPLLLVPLVILQGLLGMWTVTKLLVPLVVVLHLLGGLTTMSLLAWLAMRTRNSRVSIRAGSRLRTWALAGLMVLVVQVFLGGWTSSNYAAVSCPDFPTCQNSFWPHMDVKDAFVLWRGLGIDYQGGVLDHPARVAIHFVHRLGAMVTALVLGTVVVLAWRSGIRAVRMAAITVGIVLTGQLLLGPLMVIKGFPLALATAHNAVAALLLLSVVRLNHVLWSRAQDTGM
ncbi:MAG TPA: COX15/CtaA family protein [Steroidobacteraceae bacterium]|nr:COX15/CtaA family protein [Steroidobacteraceae bacterium]